MTERSDKVNKLRELAQNYEDYSRFTGNILAIEFISGTESGTIAVLNGSKTLTFKTTMEFSSFDKAIEVLEKLVSDTYENVF
ncbi:MAG: hypothetical protein V7L23_15165 [Nostoc sp.]|uniref:hypothetical protein n=1 Tax=Nostoc sp. TaxID=1180 RepID=UPI002FEEC67C